MDRFEKLLGQFQKHSKLLEIGGSYSPLVPRSQGWDSYSLDHATQDELRFKYRDSNVPVEKIEVVDFVWNSGTLDSIIPVSHLGTFDGCIASHVIEHAPDLVEFLMACRRVLHQDGRLCLAVPDKRFCFDYFKPISTTADVVDAHMKARQRHTKRAAFETLAYNVFLDGSVAWGQHPLEGALQFEFAGSFAKTLETYMEHPEEDAEPYRDLHGWRFTPSSFELILLELSALNLTSFTIEQVFPSDGCEFVATLISRMPPQLADAALNEQRMELLKKILLELETKQIIFSAV